ncbi:MAG TPA: glycosyltransferase [Thermoanaerobaculia bacterium]|nr:glycosyltransferase [Thermoanaerobaculia bacterium]
MKIVFVINSLEGGGAERVVSTLAFYLGSRGHDLSILTLHPPNAAYPLPAEMEVRKLSSGRFAVGPGKVLAIPLLAAELRRELKRRLPEVVVSFLVRANLVHVVSALGDHSFPVVLSERIQTTEYYRGGSLVNFMMRRLVDAMYPRADAVIAISGAVKQSLVTLNVPPEKVRVIHNPIDASNIVPRTGRSPRLDEGIVHLVSLGRFVGFKDQKTIIRALAAVHRRGLQARLTMIGDGPLRRDLEAAARALHVEQSVEFTGWIAEPHALVATADIFLFSSLYEAFGNVITEALACGVPIVSSDCSGGPQEILDRGQYGLLFPIGDSEAMADRIVQLVRDAALYERLQKKGLQRAAQFEVTAIGEQYLEAFREAIEQHRRTGRQT